MHKTVFVIQNVKDQKAFETFLKDELMPNVVKIPELLHVRVTKLAPVYENVSDVLLKLNVYIEVYFESFEAVEEVWDRQYPQAVKVTQMILDNPYGEAGLFFSQEANVPVRRNLVNY